jgi:hypothetical protein
MNRLSLARIGLCLLSMVLVCVIGGVGERLLNLFHSTIGNTGLPVVTDWVVRHYPLHSGHFFFSLTPFIILFGFMAFSRRRPGEPSFFFYAFVSVWLVALIYFGLFVSALMTPFALLMTTIGYTAVWYVVVAIDVLLIALGVVLLVRRIRRARNEAEA